MWKVWGEGCSGLIYVFIGIGKMLVVVGGFLIDGLLYLVKGL